MIYIIYHDISPDIKNLKLEISRIKLEISWNSNLKNWVTFFLNLMNYKIYCLGRCLCCLGRSLCCFNISLCYLVRSLCCLYRSLCCIVNLIVDLSDIMMTCWGQYVANFEQHEVIVMHKLCESLICTDKYDSITIELWKIFTFLQNCSPQVSF